MGKGGKRKALDLGKYHFDCKVFNGYKPCHPGWLCPGCEEYHPIGDAVKTADRPQPSRPLAGLPKKPQILLINLGACGDVLRTTAILPAVKRKYPGAILTWLTDKSSMPVLQENSLIDRLIPYDEGTIASLRRERFDVVLNIDKDLRSAALTNQLRALQTFGFALWREGVIYPVNEAALELFDLGVNDDFRFFKNQKSLQQLFAETLELDCQRDEYILTLTSEEEAFVQSYRRKIGVPEGEPLLGINTGCSDRIPYRRFVFEKHVELIETLQKENPGVKIALLGGREDTEVNHRLKERFGDRVIATPTTLGLRKGICFVKACDLVITGDSVGLHIAIALKKPVVVWFGPTSEHEIDLYDRGVKRVTQLTCHPCWKHFCDFEVKCNEVVEIQKVSEAARSILRIDGSG